MKEKDFNTELTMVTKMLSERYKNTAYADYISEDFIKNCYVEFDKNYDPSCYVNKTVLFSYIMINRIDNVLLNEAKNGDELAEYILVDKYYQTTRYILKRLNKYSFKYFCPSNKKLAKLNEKELLIRKNQEENLISHFVTDAIKSYDGKDMFSHHILNSVRTRK